MDPSHEPGVKRQSFWQKATKQEKIIIILGVLYVLSPVDIIPEVFLGPLGFLDDGGVLLLLLKKSLDIYQRR